MSALSRCVSGFIYSKSDDSKGISNHYSLYIGNKRRK